MRDDGAFDHSDDRQRRRRGNPQLETRDARGRTGDLAGNGRRRTDE
jgi:hypothetical protein